VWPHRRHPDHPILCHDLRTLKRRSTTAPWPGTCAIKPLSCSPTLYLLPHSPSAASPRDQDSLALPTHGSSAYTWLYQRSGGWCEYLLLCSQQVLSRSPAHHHTPGQSQPWDVLSTCRKDKAGRETKAGWWRRLQDWFWEHSPLSVDVHQHCLGPSDDVIHGLFIARWLLPSFLTLRSELFPGKKETNVPNRNLGWWWCPAHRLPQTIRAHYPEDFLLSPLTNNDVIILSWKIKTLKLVKLPSHSALPLLKSEERIQIWDFGFLMRKIQIYTRKHWVGHTTRLHRNHFLTKTIFNL
jgi:hypothetical protein